jgi:hypothetical protein
LTESDGTYSIGNIAPGDYYVSFVDFEGLVDEWYDNETSFSTATPVTVTAEGTTAVNAELVLGGIVTGTVRKPNGTRAYMASVDLYDSSGEWVYSDFTSGTGVYSFDSLAAGQYYLFFSGSYGLADEWYDNALTMSTATPVTVALGGTTIANAQYGLEATISGVFQVPSEFTSSEGTIGAFTGSGELVDEALGTVGEEFVIRNLQAGTYYLRLIDGWDYDALTSVDYTGADGWYLNADDLGSATGVTVSEGGSAIVSLLWEEPVVSGVSPADGPTAGATSVTITGEYLTEVTSVTFDGVVGSDLVVTSDTELTVTTPAHAAGAVDVVVTSPAGSSDVASFTYIAPPVVTLTGPATYAPGSSVVMSVSVDPALSGTGVVWYRPEGGSWTASTKTVTITGGVGSTTLNPSGVRSYRIAFKGYTSNVVTVTPVVTVTLTGPTTYAPGSSVVMSVSVDPAMSGTGLVWYQPEGGSWTASTKTVTITNGVGSVTLNPSGVKSYRIAFQGYTSNEVTLTPI